MSGKAQRAQIQEEGGGTLKGAVRMTSGKTYFSNPANLAVIVDKLLLN